MKNDFRADVIRGHEFNEIRLVTIKSSYTTEANNLEAITDICKRDGICLIKRFFSSDELERIQSGLAETDQNFAPTTPDLLSCPSLSWLLVHSGIRRIAHALLGNDLVYYLNGSINYEREIGPLTKSPYLTLHSDAFGGPHHLYQYPDRSAPFPGYRFAVYLQDYEKYSGALRVVLGSHLWTSDLVPTEDDDIYSDIELPPPSQTNAKSEDFIHYVPSQPGDLVIWNLNLVHGAGAKRLRSDPNRCLHPREEDILTKQNPSQFVPPPGPRNAIFFDYGSPSQEVDLYIKAYTQNSNVGRRKHLLVGNIDNPNMDVFSKDLPTILREDGLIVALSFQINKLRSQAGRESEVRNLYKRLHKLLKRHREFSPYFPLFDRSTFDTLDHDNWKKAVGFAQQQIFARAKAGDPTSN